MSQGKKLSAHFWNKVFLEALELSVGNISVTCKATNITPQTYYQYRSKNADLLLVFETSKTTYDVEAEADGYVQYFCETGKDYEVNTIAAIDMG